MKMKALKTFSLGGSQLTFQGEIFDTAEGRSAEYQRLGIAEPVEEGTATNEPTNSPPLDTAQTDYTEEELQAMNMTKLKEVARNIGVTGYSTMSKSELIFAIRSQQNINA